MRGLFTAVLCLAWTANAVAQATVPRSAESQHIATIIGFTPVDPGTDGRTDGDVEVERQRQMESIVACSLDVDIAIAGINNEISDLQQQQARVQARSDSRVKQLTIAGLISAGGSLIGELIEFDKSRETLGSIVESVADGVALVVGALALREEDHGRARQDVHFNMLAQVLDRPPLATSTYPDTVWKYLNSDRPGSAGVTPRQQLLTDWSRNKLLGKNGHDEATIDSLTSTHAGTVTHGRLNIDEIKDRVSMLTDTAAHISLLKKGCRDLIAETDGKAMTPPAR